MAIHWRIPFKSATRTSIDHHTITTILATKMTGSNYKYAGRRTLTWPCTSCTRRTRLCSSPLLLPKRAAWRWPQSLDRLILQSNPHESFGDTRGGCPSKQPAAHGSWTMDNHGGRKTAAAVAEGSRQTDDRRPPSPHRIQAALQTSEARLVARRGADYSSACRLRSPNFRG